MSKLKTLFLLFLGIVMPDLGESHEMPSLTRGVSKEIAVYRSKTVHDVRYELFFHISDKRDAIIKGQARIFVSLNAIDQPLILDFNKDSSHLLSVQMNGRSVHYTHDEGHILIPPASLKKGKNSILISFIAGNDSLNRNEEYLYTLLVPDRASTLFPCFDQPDIKAVYSLNLEVPSDWVAVANGKLLKQNETKSSRRYFFQDTKPLSSYLFSFVAGKFEKIERKHNNRQMSIYHRETNTKKVERNLDDIFQLLFRSLDWLEAYTGIPYPFAKYDFIAIPHFQYAGMEHTGATLYRARLLFLDESPTRKQQLRRANLIAHETAHMWFGNLITMKWFDEVWLKEVFANFIADKITIPEFPQVNHRLKFLHAHYPAAYAVDRSKGANPVIQELDNLKNAGSVYGSIIYHKAPIVMNKLEQLIGADKLQVGLQEYLKKYSYGNATWSQLIEILAKKSSADLRGWSHVWVYEPGMPKISYILKYDSVGKIKSFVVRQEDSTLKNRIWPQQLSVFLGYPNKQQFLPLDLNAGNVVLNAATGLGKPQYILVNGGGEGYGFFEMDSASMEYLLNEMHKIEVPLLRGIAWLSLWENMLHGKISPQRLLDALRVIIFSLLRCSGLFWRTTPQMLKFMYINGKKPIYHLVITRLKF